MFTPETAIALVTGALLGMVLTMLGRAGTGTDWFAPSSMRFVRQSIADAALPSAMGISHTGFGGLHRTGLAARLEGQRAPQPATAPAQQPAPLLFLPAPESLLAPADGHAVHVYETDDEIVGSVASYFEAAIAGNEAVMLIATAKHRRAIEQELLDRGLHLAADRYLALDAAETVASLCIGGEPDRDRFDTVVGGAVRNLAAMFPGVTIYDEMVGILWDRGEAISAMHLEDFWNGLGAEESFSLLCGYHSDGEWADARGSSLDGVVRLHSHLVSPRV